MNMNRLLLILCFTLFVCNLHAREIVVKDSSRVKIYFKISETNIDTSLKNNKTILDSLITLINNAEKYGILNSIFIEGYASPDGTNKHNNLLALTRAEVIRSYILLHSNADSSKVINRKGGIAWEELINFISNSSIEYKENILDILQNTPEFIYDSNKELVSGKKKILMDFNYGRSYHDLSDNFFEELRFCLITTVIDRYMINNESLTEQHAIPVVKSSALYKTPCIENTDIISEPLIDNTSLYEEKESRSFYMTIKTNLLEDVLITPNIGAEFHITNNWTLGANWTYAWWRRKTSHKYWRIYGGALYLKKYFGRLAKEKPLQGHHLGVYINGYTYDFMLDETGIMSGTPTGSHLHNFNYGGGIEYGYSLPVAKRLNLDFSIGFGYFGGKYRKYEHIDNCYVWQATNHRHWFGPTKAEISLEWLIGKGNYNRRKGGKNE